MKTAIMGARNLAFLLMEAQGSYSRDTVTIPAGAGKLEPGTVLGALTVNDEHFWPSPAAELAGKEGAEIATAVLAYAVDATDEDAQALIIARHATVKGEDLVFEGTVDDAAKTKQKIKQLKAVGILAR